VNISEKQRLRLIIKADDYITGDFFDNRLYGVLIAQYESTK
jgi:hypothetical protein